MKYFLPAGRVPAFRIGGFALLLLAISAIAAEPAGDRRLRPWAENPSYWQYKGQPVLLLGGTDDDNLFQWLDEPLRAQLDLLAETGGNYVRNTMSDRVNRGHEIYPFEELSSGKYDLDSWNTEYWRRFERFLRWTAERDIIVQIEVWDRFDHSRENWPPHPLNPKNNVNYTYEESGYAAEYPEHPGRNKQPFFYSTPGQRDNAVVLKYQQRFVDKMLSYSLQHGHILYCMDNETKGDPEWGRYWALYIKNKARQAGVRVYLTEMWDDWDIKAERHRLTLDHPELYDFVDVSQNNHNKGEQHWENALWMRGYLAANPRPINTVKTYGADGNKFGHSDDDGIERFWRHLLAGFASARFHRPDSGQGLNPKARASIRAARKLESIVKLWDLSPAQDLLGDRDDNEAYAATGTTGAGKVYVVYFPGGGPAGGAVQLKVAPGQHQVRWISVSSGEWGEDTRIREAGSVALDVPAGGHWLAVVLAK